MMAKEDDPFLLGVLAYFQGLWLLNFRGVYLFPQKLEFVSPPQKVEKKHSVSDEGIILFATTTTSTTTMTTTTI